MKDHSNENLLVKKFYYRFKSFSNPNLSFVICCDMRCKRAHLDSILKKLFSTDDPRNIELIYSREDGNPVTFQELRSHQIYFVSAKKRMGIIQLSIVNIVPTSLIEHEDIQNYDRTIAEVISEAEYEQLRMNSAYELVKERLDTYSNVLAKYEHDMNRKVFDWQKVFREKTAKSQKILSELGQVYAHFTEIEEELLNINSNYTVLETDIQKYLNKLHNKTVTSHQVATSKPLESLPDKEDSIADVEDEYQAIKIMSPTKKTKKYFA